MARCASGITVLVVAVHFSPCNLLRDILPLMVFLEGFYQTLQNLQSYFHIIEHALTDLKLLLNPKKTKCILSTRLSPSLLIDSSSSTLNGTLIERVSNYISG